MMIGARTAAWAKAGGGMPYDFECDCIISSGHQYIDTLKSYRQNDTIGLVYDPIYGTGNYPFWCGDGSTSNSNVCFGDINTNSNWPILYAGGTNFHRSGTKPPVSITLKNNRCIVNGIDLSEMGSTYTDRDSVFIFATRNGNNPYFKSGSSGTNSGMRLYSFFFTDSMDLIPVVKDGVGCLFNRADPTSGENGDGIFENKGSGTFGWRLGEMTVDPT